MKKQLYFIFVFIGVNFLSGSGYSQEKLKEDDARIKLWQDKKSEYFRKNEGVYDGYRIKIHFGSDKTRARDVKSKFLSKFPDINAYEEYQQPNFVILVGDYRNKPEAYLQFKKIQIEFPNAFIVRDKIKPPKL
jgi:hypothetical protein